MRCKIGFLVVLSVVLAGGLHAVRAEEKVLLPDSRQAGQTWAYTLNQPAADWMKADFDDSKWRRGPGGFGRRGTPGSVVRTDWHTKDIWLRHTFTLAELPKRLAIDIHHDEDAEVYLNGKLVLQTEKYLVNYKRFLLPSEAVAALKRGKNVVAVYCKQTVGGQYIDVGLVGNPKEQGEAVALPKAAVDPHSPDAVSFYEKQVKPILEANCFRCHGGERERGSLNMTHRAGLLKGGDTGPAVDLKNIARSHLLAMISYRDEHHQMPPKGKLPQKEFDIVTKWVQMGAPMPGDGSDPINRVTTNDPLITEEAKNYWAYKKPVRPPVPEVKNKDWVTNPIDAFLLAKLEAKELSPAPPLEKIRLIRRATYDLTGLPPTPKEVEDFLNDKSSNAYEKLLDRLLSSPHYGEKWGRHWLDLVRYAETNGYEYDEAKPDAWKYRDYVIKSFNEDKPYDRFLLEQLAGDELKDASEETRIATIYYRLGIYDTHAPDGLEREFDMYDDIVKTTTEVVLGMTMGCARCHDHKKDPLPQTDYYRFLAFFRNIRPDWKNPVVEHGPQPRPTHLHVRGNPHVKGKEVQPGYPQVLVGSDPINRVTTNKTGKSSGRRLTAAQWLASKDNPLTARVMVNRIWQHHFGRGIVPTPSDFGKLGQPPTHPELLDWLAVEFMERGWSIKAMHKLMMTSSAYRMSSKDNADAEKIDPDNELFWRFNMRRLTAEEIRDSVLFVDGTLDKKLGGPSVYPELPIEVIRTSSKFNPRANFVGGGFWQKPKPEYEVRRTIYTFVRRSLLHPMLTSLDLADTDNSCPVRFTTTVPTQALTLLNSKFMNDHAKLFAQRLQREAGNNPRDQVALALRLVTQRPPEEKEIARGVRLIRELREEGVSEAQAMQHFCLVALNLNEFVYLD